MVWRIQLMSIKGRSLVCKGNLIAFANQISAWVKNIYFSIQSNIKATSRNCLIHYLFFRYVFHNGGFHQDQNKEVQSETPKTKIIQVCTYPAGGWSKEKCMIEYVCSLTQLINWKRILKKVNLLVSLGWRLDLKLYFGPPCAIDAVHIEKPPNTPGWLSLVLYERNANCYWMLNIFKWLSKFIV